MKKATHLFTKAVFIKTAKMSLLPIQWLLDLLKKNSLNLIVLFCISLNHSPFFLTSGIQASFGSLTIFSYFLLWNHILTFSHVTYLFHFNSPRYKAIYSGFVTDFKILSPEIILKLSLGSLPAKVKVLNV